MTAEQLVPDEPEHLAQLLGEASAAAEGSRYAAITWSRLSPAEQLDAAREAEAWRAGLRASVQRAGFASEDEYLAAVLPGAPPVAPGPSWRTLADILDTAPPPLRLGWLEDGPTLAYGAPGVGKGTTGAWTVCEGLSAGMRPMIFDAERRPREWARRVSGLGGDRSRIVYLEPMDLGSKLAGRPFWEQVEAVRGIVAAAGVDLFLLDSLLPASGIGEDRLKSDAQAPFLFVSALDSLGIPSLAFGHPPKGQPEGDPFGSMAWQASVPASSSATVALVARLASQEGFTLERAQELEQAWEREAEGLGLSDQAPEYWTLGAEWILAQPRRP